MMANPKTITFAAAAALAAIGCSSVADPSEEECDDPTGELCGDPDGGVEPGGPAVAPTIEVLFSEIFDERDDEVTFNEDRVPVAFTHTGEATVLGDDDCPRVFKHAYLLDPSTSATESPANPLRFMFQVSVDPQLAPEGTSGFFRVRRAGESEFLGDPVVATSGPVGDGEVTFFADLDLAAVPELAYEQGLFEVELIGIDNRGREVTAIRCFDYQPLAGPIHVSSAQSETELNSLKLAANSFISVLLNGKGTHDIMSFELTNGTPHEAYATLTTSPITGTCQKTWEQSNVLTSRVPDKTACDFELGNCPFEEVPDELIEANVPCSPAISSSASKFGIRVKRGTVEGDVPVLPCQECEGTRYLLPPNSTSRVEVEARDLPGLQPRFSTEPELTTTETLNVTGTIVDTVVQCKGQMLPDGTVVCGEKSTFKVVRFVQKILVALGPVEVDVDLSASPVGTSFAPTDSNPSPSIGGYSWSTTESSSAPSP
jgi:hypothetical protein